MAAPQLTLVERLVRPVLLPRERLPQIGINSNATIHALRLCVERTFAWEDKFKRLLLRFERIQQRHYGMKLLAYTLINLRAFCGV